MKKFLQLRKPLWIFENRQGDLFLQTKKRHRDLALWVEGKELEEEKLCWTGHQFSLEAKDAAHLSLGHQGAGYLGRNKLPGKLF